MPHKVLLIDDTPEMAPLVQAMLAGEAVALHYAPDGASGLELARQLRPDLILLDVEMPFPDGFEVCRRLKLDPATLATPIVFLTGVSGTRDKILGLDMGAVDFVSKPLDSADLRARLRSALRLKRLGDLLAGKARVDPVTGLWNEDFFRARLAAELALSRRTPRPLAVVLANIDHFRRLNSEHGPWSGDEVLSGVAELLASGIRQEDVLCRCEGATLGIICPSSTLEGAEIMSRRLSVRISGMQLSLRGSPVTVTASFGIAGRPPGGSVEVELRDAASICSAARQALLKARNDGPGRVVSADASMYLLPTHAGPETVSAPRRRDIARTGDTPHAA